MNDMNKMMQQAQEMQRKVQEFQSKLGELEAEGASGGGLVTVTMSGNIEVKKVKIDPSLIKSDEAEMLEDLLAAAFNEAKAKVDDMSREEMGKLSSSMNLPKGMGF